MTETEKTPEYEAVEAGGAPSLTSYVVVRERKKDLAFWGEQMGSAEGGSSTNLIVTIYRTAGGLWVASMVNTSTHGVTPDAWYAETLDLLAEEVKEGPYDAMEVFKLAMADAGQPYVQDIE